jgi:chromosome partitioning protein
MRWFELQERFELVCVGMATNQIGRQIQIYAHHDFIVIDGPPGLHARTKAAILAADVVLMPVQPSSADVWAVGSIAELIQGEQEVTGKPHGAFVVSRAISGTRAADAITPVLEGLGHPVLKGRISQRVAYAEALGLGESVIEYEPRGKAADEIRAITNEVLQLSGHGKKKISR